MTIPELRAMLEVLTEEDFRAVIPLERCNSSYVRLMEENKKLREKLAAWEPLISFCFSDYCWAKEDVPPENQCECEICSACRALAPEHLPTGKP